MFGRGRQVVVRVTLGDRKSTLCIVLIVLYFSSMLTMLFCCITCKTTPHSRLVIKGNTPDQDLLVGVVSWGFR